jgi:hypothetical protein
MNPGDIQQVAYRIIWRFDDRAGNAVFNDVRALKDAQALPPLPDVGAKLRVEIKGRQMMCEVIDAYLDYTIDGTPNLLVGSHVIARER